MLTIKDMVEGKGKLTETELAELSDQLWQLGNLQTIQKQVDPNLFLLHIGINMIGYWMGEGWWGIFCDQGELLPYLPKVLEAFGLPKLKTTLDDILSMFPKATHFSSEDPDYQDLITFFENARFPVSKEARKQVPMEERRKMVKQMQDKIGRLDELSTPIWGYGAIEDGWEQVLQYIKKYC